MSYFRHEKAVPNDERNSSARQGVGPGAVARGRRWSECRRGRPVRGSRGAHVRRSTGSIKKPVSSRQIRWAPRRRSFFYRGPVHPNPLAHPLIIALLGPRLRPLRAEATRTEQSTDVIRMVGDVEVVTDEVDDPSTRP